MPPATPRTTTLARLPSPIKDWLRRAAVGYLGLLERRRFASRKIVWLLGHMRSGSTLLMHLLSSHPQILGAGERNAPYSSERDLRRLAVDAAYTRRQFFRHHAYVVDQINHNRFLTAVDLLDHPQVYRIFLVREPRGALASMVEVLGRFYGMTLEEAVDYYLERLSALAGYAQSAAEKSRSFFLTYDELVKRPRPVLRRLQSFLLLATPLPETYRLFEFTGGRGDPSRRGGPRVRARGP